MAAGPWILLGAPLDSAAAGEGEERAPAALRELDLGGAIGAEDRGDACRTLTDPARDPETGVIAFDQLVEASGQLAATVRDVVECGARPFVAGGDCSLLPGALAGARAAGTEPGLWFVDGHADFLDGESSPTGEAADMDLAQVAGGAPAPLAAVWGGGTLVPPGRVTILGHRPASSGADVAAELARVPADVEQHVAAEVIAAGPAALGDRLADGRDAAWLHLDLDVLDPSVFPAVSYPQEGGLGWEELEALARPLASAPGLVGISVADYNPDRDPGRELGRRVVALLRRLTRG